MSKKRRVPVALHDAPVCPLCRQRNECSAFAGWGRNFRQWIRAS
jgi:hypothetical protein